MTAVYEPKTPRTRWVRDAVIAALREHGRLNTTELTQQLGYLVLYVTPGKLNWCDHCQTSHGGIVKRRVTSQVIQPTMTSMERHNEIERHRERPSAIYTWALGDGAPAAIDLSEFEALL